MLEKLTRKERKQFRQSGFESPEDWLAYRLSKELAVPITNRQHNALRWLEYLRQTKRWVPSLVKLESFIHDDDIVTGRESVKKVLRKAEIRRTFSTDQLAPVPSWYSGDTRTIRLLNSAQDIVITGAELEVCLDRDVFRERYINDTASGLTHIFVIKTRCGISAFELTCEKSLIQHRTYNNGLPNVRHEAILRAFMSRIGGTIPHGISIDEALVNEYRMHVETENARLRVLAEVNRMHLEAYSAQVEMYARRVQTIADQLIRGPMPIEDVPCSAAVL